MKRMLFAVLGGLGALGVAEAAGAAEPSPGFTYRYATQDGRCVAIRGINVTLPDGTAVRRSTSYATANGKYCEPGFAPRSPQSVKWGGCDCELIEGVDYANGSYEVRSAAIVGTGKAVRDDGIIWRLSLADGRETSCVP